MVRVIGVRFRTAGKIYFFDPLEFEIKKGDHVIVETARGIEFGTVMAGAMEVSEEKVVQPLKPVIRIANQRDVEQEEANRGKEKEAFRICLEKIRDHGLEMKLIDAEYTFDNNKVLFYFTADGRIDFRELVKDLASVFKTRIELPEKRGGDLRGAEQAASRHRGSGHHGGGPEGHGAERQCATPACEGGHRRGGREGDQGISRGKAALQAQAQQEGEDGAEEEWQRQEQELMSRAEEAQRQNARNRQGSRRPPAQQGGEGQRPPVQRTEVDRRPGQRAEGRQQGQRGGQQRQGGRRFEAEQRQQAQRPGTKQPTEERSGNRRRHDTPRHQNRNRQSSQNQGNRENNQNGKNRNDNRNRREGRAPEGQRGAGDGQA